MKETRYISTARVAQALGVGVSTVKRWVDEGVLPAYKTAGGHRKLLLQDVLRLVREKNFPQIDLHRLEVELRFDSHRLDLGQVSNELYRFLLAGQQEASLTLLQRTYHGGVGMENLADQVVGPAMVRIGLDWQEGRIDVLHEHRASLCCTGTLVQLRAKVESPARGKGPLAVGGSPEGHWHSIANHLIELMLLDNGWEVINLGANTPMISLARAIREFHPRLVWVSIHTLQEPEVFLKEYEAVVHAARDYQSALAVGGPGMVPEVRSRMIYTTFGDGISHLANFARTLYPRPMPRRRGRPAGGAK